MQSSWVGLVALCLLATALAQDSSCDLKACRTAIECPTQERQKRLEKTVCEERCATAAGVSQCFGEKRSESDAKLMACVEGRICTTDNIAKALAERDDRSGQYSDKGKGKGRKGRRGSSSGKGKGEGRKERRGSSSGKGKGGGRKQGSGPSSDKGKGGKRKPRGCEPGGKGELEQILGDQMTDNARRFEECVTGCRKCDENQTECPEVEGCPITVLKYVCPFAVRSCRESTGIKKKERSGKDFEQETLERCKCMVGALAPGAESACDEMAGRKSERGGGGKGKGYLL